MGNDWSEQFKSLLSSPLGVELVRTLREDLHNGIIRSAETAETQETAFGLLKEARGVIRSVEHLQFMAVTTKTPKDEGSKTQK